MTGGVTGLEIGGVTYVLLDDGTNTELEVSIDVVKITGLLLGKFVVATELVTTIGLLLTCCDSTGLDDSVTIDSLAVPTTLVLKTSLVDGCTIAELVTGGVTKLEVGGATELVD